MTEHLSIDSNILAYDLIGDGPLVVLAHGMGDSRHAYRFVAPQLAAAGYRVANVDIRGCGESSPDWDGYSRTDIAGPECQAARVRSNLAEAKSCRTFSTRASGAVGSAVPVSDTGVL